MWREQPFLSSNSSDPYLPRAAVSTNRHTISILRHTCIKLDQQNKHAPLVPKDPENIPPLHLPSRALRTDTQTRSGAHRPNRKRAPTAVLEVRQTLICPLRLNNDSAVPAGVDEPRPARAWPGTDELWYRDAERLPARGRANRERRAMHPAHDHVMSALRSVMCQQR